MCALPKPFRHRHRYRHYLLSFFLLLTASITASAVDPKPVEALLPSDAVALLKFKLKADIGNKLLYNLNERFDYCQWQGAKCVQGRVVRFVLQGCGLSGIFADNTLTRLDQLRVLSLRNNSLSGVIPDLSPLTNLKTLFLDHNAFSGTFPLPLVSLHRLRSLDLARNSLAGPLPIELNSLDRLTYLRLEWNRFNGSLPPLNITTLEVFNVTGNNLTGSIPVTPALSRFDISSYLLNPGLCGKILNKICDSKSPFFDDTPPGVSAPAPLLQNVGSQGLLASPPSTRRHRRIGIILGFIIGLLILIAIVLLLVTIVNKRRNRQHQTKSVDYSSDEENETENEIDNRNVSTFHAISTNTASEVRIVSKEAEIKEKKLELPQHHREKSGNLIFCEGESAMYSLEQLMSASAELLGRGVIGTTYKAVMDNQLIVTVKRLDAGKTATTSGEAFERHLEAVGGLRHPNLVPVRAYFQAKQERLVIYDYQPNGSLYNLIHGEFFFLCCCELGV